MDKPLVSILIPTYNNSLTIGRCLQSLLDQDYENLVVVTLDNRSDDDTYDILLDFERKNRDRIYTGRTFTHLSQHEHRAYCFGMMNPRSLFIQYLPATDVLLPNYVSRCVELGESSEQIGCVLTHADIIHPSGKIESASRFHPSDCIIPGDAGMESFMANGLDLNVAKFFRKEVYYVSLGEGFVFNCLLDWVPMVTACSVFDIGYVSDGLALRGDSKAIQAEAFVPELAELFEHYLFLHAFNNIAVKLERQRVRDKFPNALRRLSLDCIRCCAQLSKLGDVQNAMAYLSLALAYLPEIAQTDAYRQAAASFENLSKALL